MREFTKEGGECKSMIEGDAMAENVRTLGQNTLEDDFAHIAELATDQTLGIIYLIHV